MSDDAATPPPAKPKPAEQPVSNNESGESKGQTGKEVGGPKGPEPTRFGDWEQKGRCSDF
ncbi:MAG: DUF1674 domain-containing protein [Rhodospirillaceae bacterium]